ncbi:MAG: cation diffusion facilitator family transporter [Atopobiaceae bacterium]|jgi:cation diffusion facilitator family transporter|nr:cation diffusion facilitator family transporter [Atopobiaceae bacterium]MCI2208389.1 cation diffusion facilitator family transporter [Atopobiaceae bacterium]
MDSYERFRKIQFVLWLILFLNLVVALAKYFYGIWTGSVSMKADGIASMFDTASNLIGIVGMHLASRPADQGHPYGHAKFETYASAFIGVMLLFAAYNVATDAFAALTGGSEAVEVNFGSFAVMVGTLVVNVFVSRYERGRGTELRSEILTADALHTMSDAFVSVSVIVGLVFVGLGFPIADPICSIIVAVAILHSAWEVFRQANATLSDEARIPIADVEQVACGVAGVRGCHKVRTRGTEGEVYMDLHVLVDPQMPIVEAHAVGDHVEEAVRSSFDQVVDVMVHLEPDVPEERLVEDDVPPQVTAHADGDGLRR